MINKTEIALISTGSASASQKTYNIDLHLQKSHFFVENSFFFIFLLIRKTDNKLMSSLSALATRKTYKIGFSMQELQFFCKKRHFLAFFTDKES